MTVLFTINHIYSFTTDSDTTVFLIDITLTFLCSILQFLICRKLHFFLKFCEIFHINVQNIDGGFSLEPPQREAVLTSTHNQCFRAKIRKLKKIIPLLGHCIATWYAMSRYLVKLTGLETIRGRGDTVT